MRIQGVKGLSNLVSELISDILFTLESSNPGILEPFAESFESHLAVKLSKRIENPLFRSGLL